MHQTARVQISKRCGNNSVIQYNVSTRATLIIISLAPRGAGAPLFPLVHSLPRLLLFFTFPVFQWL